MNASSFTRLEDVVLADEFPDLDLALRRGQHIDRDSGTLYSFLIDAQPYLETFYRRYGCELIHSTDGFFYLLPTGDRLGRRHLSPGEMLVGQALTLLYLDPATVQQGGLVGRDQLLGYLAGLVGTESLLRLFNPKKRRFDERVAEEAVRTKVGEALRRLAGLGFIEILSDGQMRLRPALMRFAEPVRGSATPELALERLVAKGELVLAPLEEAEEEHPAQDEAEDGEDPEEAPLDPEIYDTDFEPLEDADLGSSPAPRDHVLYGDGEDQEQYDDDGSASHQATDSDFDLDGDDEDHEGDGDDDGDDPGLDAGDAEDTDAPDDEGSVLDEDDELEPVEGVDAPYDGFTVPGDDDAPHDDVAAPYHAVAERSEDIDDIDDIDDDAPDDDALNADDFPVPDEDDVSDSDEPG
ncbi:MAG: hypothetical protein GX607_22740, partial [Myxococcales bacterium]|nr:hypothetical protein [Myxococcales bacterium]